MVGICVIYLVDDPVGYRLLELSLDQIERTTAGPYRLYGCCPDGDPETLRRLAARGVEVHAAGDPARVREPQVEHSELLNALADAAASDGCSHLATFDMDSWPILPGWDQRYAGALTGQAPVASIVRTELGDNFPFAAFTMMAREFWRVGESSFSTRLRGSFDEDALGALSRPEETGSGIAVQLGRDGLTFLRLERSNRWEVHHVIAGIYDDAVFHLGAGSRAPQFINDNEVYAIDGSPLRRRFATQMNRAVSEAISEQLLAEHDALMSELAGGALRPLEPIPTDPRTVPRHLAHTPVERRLLA